MTREYYKKSVWAVKEYENITNLNKALIDEIFDHFEQKESELRAEFQKKISEINLEHESRVCENCEFFNIQDIDNNSFSICNLGVETSYKRSVFKAFGCNDFKRKE